MLHIGYVIIIGIAALQNIVSARFCDGGHRCSPPKECCPQGCCYLYAPPTSPKTTPPTTDHLLSLVFINHWYFWFLVVAIVMAVLCACSLWRKRRQLCGWGSPHPHSQSGDSAGSCYAPPQYSRCSSFHHAPPPYTEVTSKPDLYPLVFSCDNTKNGVGGGGVGMMAGHGNSGSSYLMVQYFRNYIVRPVGSMSATSTVDSISSSFICSANEQNTQVPPPYSRAASPADLISPHMTAVTASSISSYCLPRSASQLHICSIESNDTDTDEHHQLQASAHRPMFSTRNGEQPTRIQIATADLANSHYESNVDSLSHSVPGGSNDIRSESKVHRPHTIAGSDFQSIYMNSGICISEGCFTKPPTNDQYRQSSTDNPAVASGSKRAAQINNWSDPSDQRNSRSSHNSCGSMEGTSDGTQKSSLDNNANHELDRLRQSLETCCHLLQQQQEHQQQLQQSSSAERHGSNGDDLAHNQYSGRKYTESIGSFVNSNIGSTVSSLANIGPPGSPPRATSPTGEIKELLEQIRQLRKSDNGSNQDLAENPSNQQRSQESQPSVAQRPSSLHNNARKDFFGSRPSSTVMKNMRYSPISGMPAIVSKRLRSPNGGSTAYSSLLLLSKGRKSWVTRSAPTTPGSVLPPCFVDDDSPLLNEQDEDQENDDTEDHE